MIFEERNIDDDSTEVAKLDKNGKTLFAQITRGSNSYASLPNHGNSTKGGRTIFTASELPAQAANNIANYCTANRRQSTGSKKKQWLKSTPLTATTSLTKTSHTHETEAAQQKLPPYMNLNNESCDDDHSFGLSNDLSTESIKKACDRYDDDDDDDDDCDNVAVADDVSDDDLIEVQRTPHCFQKTSSVRRSLKQQTALTIDRQRKRRKLDEHPLCTLPRSNSSTKQLDGIHAKKSPTTVAQDEVIDVLNELDAILDDHTASSSMLDFSLQSTLSNEGETKIEDCLLDLDNYLDGIDDGSVINDYDDDDVGARKVVSKSTLGHSTRRNRTLPRNLYAFPATPNGQQNDETSLQRGHKLRRTISSDLMTTRNNREDATLPTSSTSINWLTPPRTAEWRRNSMRKTAALILPSTAQDDSNAGETAVGANSENSEAVDQTAQPDANNHDWLQLETSHRFSTSADLRRCYSQSHVPAHTDASLPNPNEMLTTANILQNILVQSEAAASNDTTSQERPRQFGRRALEGPAGRVLTMHADAHDANNCLIQTSGNQRPLSAPAASVVRHSLGSEPSSFGSSRNASPVSLVSTSTSTDDSSSTTTLHITHGHEQLSSAETTVDTNLSTVASDAPLDPDNIQLLARPGNNAFWPHSFSRILALICCSLGLFNICRFAILTIQYGGNFLLQFLLLSSLFGIPLLWLQMCLGAKIKAGPVTMWKISPICKGVGIALTLLQCIMTIYSSIGVAWVLIYLRDSFLDKTQTLYRWQEPFFNYRHSANSTANLTETVADYFNGFVLQRVQMVWRSDTAAVRLQVSDRLAFNLALIWAFVFLVLCKGLKSYGKIVLGLAILPLLTLIVITCKLLTVIDLSALQNIFSANDFEDFLVNSKTWSAAAQEAFLTWGLWGPSVIAMSSRLHGNTQSKEVLRRDAILVVITTLFGLSVAALFGLACVQILNENDYIYIPGSYEHMESYTAVYSLRPPINTALISFPTKWLPHYSSLLGETYRRPSSALHRESGYQALRLISELFPAAMSLCTESMSWIWVAVTFGMFLLFGLAQMCAMWKPISSALGNSTSSVLLSCVTALLLSIPFSTEMGIGIVHYMDLVMGGAWILPILWTALIFGVFLIRGRPYNGDDLVNDLRMSGSMSAFLALSWNVLLPIGLVALAIVDYKTSNSGQLYHWRGKSYFSLWARKLAGLIQIAFLMLVPITALVQIYRYLTNGPPDILDRIQLLYRPSQSLLDARAARSTSNDRNNLNINTRNASGPGLTGNTVTHTQDDAPPKYTPPPSYTTATGARLAKILRQSIRRSVRRLINGRARPELSLDATNQPSLPPDYTALHMSENIEIGQRPLGSSGNEQRALSLGRNIHLQKLNLLETAAIQQRPSSATPSTEHHLSRDRPVGRPYTAQDVATILRSSTRRVAQRRIIEPTRDDIDIDASEANCSSYSAENLILNAEPLGESAAIAAPTMQQVSDDASRSSSAGDNDATVI